MNLSGDTFRVLTTQRGAYALLLTQVEVLARLELLNKDVSVLSLQAVGLLDLVFTSIYRHNLYATKMEQLSIQMDLRCAKALLPCTK